MRDRECTEFLQWCLPRLHMRWPGFRKVRSQVCKRIGRRMGELGLPRLSAYREYVEVHGEEWELLDSLCRITISRFYRDRGVFDVLRTGILPSMLARAARRGEGEVRAWSAGCGSGEEPYTLQIIWNLCVTPGSGHDLPLRITATDADQALIERGRRGLFSAGSLKDLPPGLVQQAFDQSGSDFAVSEELRENIVFECQDIRSHMPDGRFSLILCRNLVFTYFDHELQSRLLEGITGKLADGGILLIGVHETLPKERAGLESYGSIPCIFRKIG